MTRESKYRNQKTVVDGISFDSKAEARRWQQLQLRARAKQITMLERQVRFPLEVNGKRVASYVADFVYVENRRQVVEDVKGVATPVYRLKKKLMSAIHNVEIVEVRA